MNIDFRCDIDSGTRRPDPPNRASASSKTVQSKRPHPPRSIRIVKRHLSDAYAGPCSATADNSTTESGSTPCRQTAGRPGPPPFVSAGRPTPTRRA